MPIVFLVLAGTIGHTQTIEVDFDRPIGVTYPEVFGVVVKSPAEHAASSCSSMGRLGEIDLALGAINAKGQRLVAIAHMSEEPDTARLKLVGLGQSGQVTISVFAATATDTAEHPAKTETRVLQNSELALDVSLPAQGLTGIVIEHN